LYVVGSWRTRSWYILDWFRPCYASLGR
jgi:hypothetical protein